MLTTELGESQQSTCLRERASVMASGMLSLPTNFATGWSWWSMGNRAKQRVQMPALTPATQMIPSTLEDILVWVLSNTHTWYNTYTNMKKQTNKFTFTCHIVSNAYRNTLCNEMSVFYISYFQMEFGRRLFQPALPLEVVWETWRSPRLLRPWMCSSTRLWRSKESSLSPVLL